MAADFSMRNISGERLPASFKVSANKIIKRVERIAGKKFEAVSLVLVTPEKIKQLNSIYRHHHKVTDVLSFIYKNNQAVAGEIFICLRQAHQQAKEFGVSFKQELEFLLVHGCLHILGYDHIKSKEKKIMAKLEFKVLGRSRRE